MILNLSLRKADVVFIGKWGKISATNSSCRLKELNSPPCGIFLLSASYSYPTLLARYAEV